MFMTSAPSRLPASSKERLRARRGFEEEIDLGAAAQRRASSRSGGLASAASSARSSRNSMSARESPSMPRRWRCGVERLATASVIKGAAIGASPDAGKRRCAHSTGLRSGIRYGVG